MGRAGHDLRALLEGFLEMRPDQAEHVRHIVHDGGLYPLLIHEFADLRDRLSAEHHALAEDDQLGLVLGNDLLRLLDVDLIDIVRADREVHHGVLLGHGVDRDVVVQGAHGLRRKVPALDDMIVQHVAKALRRRLPVQTVLEIHEGGENGGVCHLAAGHAGLCLLCAEVFLHLPDQLLFDPVDELRALVVENILVVEGSYGLVLRVAAARIGGREQAHRPARGVFRRDQVDAAALSPLVIFRGFADQADRLFQAAAFFRRRLRERIAVDDRARVGRRHGVEVPLRDHRFDALAADIHLYFIVRQQVGVHIGHADRTLHDFFRDHGFQTFALRLIEGHHGPAGDPAHLLFTSVERHAGAHDAALKQRDALHAARQGGIVRKIAVHDPLPGGILPGQRGFADVLALLRRKAHGKARNCGGIDGHGHAVCILSHLVAVERKSRFQTQGISGTEAGRAGAQPAQTIPQPGGVFTLYEDLIAERLAGVAGLRDPRLPAFQQHGIHVILHGLRHLRAVRERHQHVLALRSLDRNAGQILRDIGDAAVIAADVFCQVRQILIDVRGVHHEQQTVLLKAVEVSIVHGAAVFLRQDAVHRAAGQKAFHVRAHDVLQEADAVRSLH